MSTIVIERNGRVWNAYRVTDAYEDEQGEVEYSREFLSTHPDQDSAYEAYNIVRYVSCYEVTREYGGPEEGGWYYDAFYLRATIPFKTAGEREWLMAHVDRMFENEGRPIWSVRPGTEYAKYVETVSGSHDTTERPRFQ